MAVGAPAAFSGVFITIEPHFSVAVTPVRVAWAFPMACCMWHNFPPPLIMADVGIAGIVIRAGHIIVPEVPARILTVVTVQSVSMVSAVSLLSMPKGH